MASTEQENIHAAINDNAPTVEAELVSWALVAEWRLPDGQRYLSGWRARTPRCGR